MITVFVYNLKKNKNIIRKCVVLLLSVLIATVIRKLSEKKIIKSND